MAAGLPTDRLGAQLHRPACVIPRSQPITCPLYTRPASVCQRRRIIPYILLMYNLCYVPVSTMHVTILVIGYRRRAAATTIWSGTHSTEWNDRYARYQGAARLRAKMFRMMIVSVRDRKQEATPCRNAGGRCTPTHAGLAVGEAHARKKRGEKLRTGTYDVSSGSPRTLGNELTFHWAAMPARPSRPMSPPRLCDRVA